MENKTTAPGLKKSKIQALFELCLLILCISLMGLRITLTETPNIQSADQIAGHSSTLYSLTLSAVLIIAFIAWLIFNFCSNRFFYRFTSIEAGLLLLIIASVIAASAASNIRSAINNAVIFIAPIFMIILLVQILDTTAKIQLTLAVIAALGFLCAYQCSEQFYDTNEQLIRQYEQNPNQMLQPLNIQPGSLSHFQFEHRLFSKDIKAFFTTGNSAGSFAILSLFAAAALFINKLKNRKNPASDPWHYITTGALFAVVLIGLLLTHSKGAIGATAIALILFALLWFFGSWLNTHKKTILIISLLLITVAACAVISYGLSHDKLPGGKSMLVRWQYWYAAAKIAAANPYTGIGPGNFGTAYLHYKLPHTIETVSDPHNFPLSLLTQYGPLGLIAFLMIIFIPIWRINLTASSSQTSTIPKTKSNLKKLLVIFVPLTLLTFRPLALPMSYEAEPKQIAAGILIIFLIPAIAYIIGFLLITNGPLYGSQQTKNKVNITTIALLSAMLGWLIHNLIDFAIFEPPVFTAFCATIACLIASDLNSRQATYKNLKTSPFIKIITVLAGIAAITAFFYYCFVPVVKSTSKIAYAKRAAFISQYELAHQLLNEAAEDDPFSPNAPLINGELYLQSYLSQPRSRMELLIEAEKSYLLAKKRDPRRYTYYEKLTGVYTLISEISTEPQKTEWLNKALDAANQAIELYPASGRLHFSSAEIAEHLGKTDIAAEHYKKAVEIEDAFREHFKQMYPDREVFSRLGRQVYIIAKQKIEKLKN